MIDVLGLIIELLRDRILFGDKVGLALILAMILILVNVLIMIYDDGPFAGAIVVFIFALVSLLLIINSILEIKAAIVILRTDGKYRLLSFLFNILMPSFLLFLSIALLYYFVVVPLVSIYVGHFIL